MQSSPPQRVPQAPPSPETSNYSINLDALELDSHSGTSTPLPTQKIDRVLSSDIDGPSDFTLNMEKWMRGGLRKKGLESLKEKKEEAATPEKKHEEAETAQSNHTPSNSPPKQSVVGEEEPAGDAVCDADEEDDQWDPYEEARSPPTAKKDGQKALLQPTVEEYYSELTPAKFAYSRARRFSKERSGEVEEQDQTLHEDDAIPSPGALSSPFDSPVRSPVSQRPAAQFSHSQRIDLDEELNQLRARCKQLEHLNSTLNQTIISERLQRETNTAAHEAQIAEFSRREQDLEDMKNQSQQHSSDFRREFSELKDKLQTYETQHSGHRSELERLRQAHVAEVQDLRSQLETQKSEHDADIQELEQDVELAKRSREDAEEGAKTAQQQLEDSEREVEKLKAEIEQGEELREGIKEQLRSKMMEVERLASEKRNAEDATKKVEVDRLGDLQRVETLSAELEELRMQLQTEKAQVQALTEAAESRSEESDDELRADLNDAIIERDALQDEVDALKAQLAEEKAGRETERQAAREVGDAFNAKIAGAIRTREQYWRTRVTAAKEERKVMAKALLRSWGREEMDAPDTLPRLKVLDGDEEHEWADRVGGEEQEYRYIFGGRSKSGSGDPDRKADNVIEVLEILDRERVQKEGDRRVVLDIP